MADNTTELEVLNQIVEVLGGQSGQYETVVPVLQQIKELLAAGITDPEAIAEAVAAWLDEHPEATTTVQDGSITGVKIADDTIPDAKLAQTGGVLSEVHDARIGADTQTYTSAGVALRNVNNIVVECNNAGHLAANGNRVNQPTSKNRYSDVVPIPSCVKKVGYRLYGNYTGQQSLGSVVGMVMFYDNDTGGSRHIVQAVYDANGVTEGTVDVPTGATHMQVCKWAATDNPTYYCVMVVDADQPAKNADAISTQQTQLDKLLAVNRHGDSIAKPFDFSGKSMYAYGDSITAGVTSPNLQSGTPYVTYFKDMAGLSSVTNMAISGSCISGGDQYSIYNRITGESQSNAQFVLIAGGTNDFSTSKPLGTFEDTEPTTFYGCLRGICEYLTANYTGKVIFITPIPFTQASRFHDWTNDVGCTIDDYRAAIYEVATIYGYSVVDGANLGMPTGIGGWSNAMCADSDGCHPTNAGHQLYARSLAGKLL